MSKWLLTAFEISGGGNSIKYQASKRPSTPPNQQPQHLVGVFFGCWQTYKPPSFASQPPRFTSNWAVTRVTQNVCDLKN